jgi:hypothetical protein
VTQDILHKSGNQERRGGPGMTTAGCHETPLDSRNAANMGYQRFPRSQTATCGPMGIAAEMIPSERGPVHAANAECVGPHRGKITRNEDG